MFSRLFVCFRCLSLPLLLLGCDVKIGDSCVASSDCSQSESRLCLSEAYSGFPGGYCTKYCIPGSCPSEAVCIGYRSRPSSVVQCGDALELNARTKGFCMARCSSDGDCRGGYACVDVVDTAQPWGAELLETSATSSKVCVLAYEAPEGYEDTNDSRVCTAEPDGPEPDPVVVPLRDTGLLVDDAGASLGVDLPGPDAGDSGR